MKDVLKWVTERLQEPSSYAALAGLALALHVNVDPGLLKSVTLIGTGVGGVLAFVLKEQM